MNNSNVYTEDMAIIMQSSRERYLALQILTAWDKHGLPDDFYEDNIRYAFNRNSGNVFLVNEEYQCAMMNGDKLESFYSSPYDGHEGFIDELLDSVDDHWHEDDIEWLNDIKANLSDD